MRFEHTNTIINFFYINPVLQYAGIIALALIAVNAILPYLIRRPPH